MNRILLITFALFSKKKNELKKTASLFLQQYSVCLPINKSAAGKGLSIFFFISLFFLVSFKSYGQCTFGNTVFGTTQSICYDSNSGSTQFTGVPLGRYVRVNVIQGLNYSITLENNNYSTFHIRGTIYNGSDTGTPLAFIDGGDYIGSVTLNWTASFTGQLYVQYNEASNCALTVGNNATITVTYKGGNNGVDSQTTASINSWIGHVYDFAQTVGALPATNDAYANYLGYFSQPNATATSFTQDFGGSNVCFPFTAIGTAQTIRTENFAVRYRMNTTPAVYPAGCYFVTIRADDGVKLSVDGVLVLDEWKVQQATTYSNIMVYLTGNSQLVLDYYDNNDQNQCDFSITPVNPSSNSISTPGPIYRCINTSTFLDASSFWYNGYNTSNPTIKYEWQLSTDNFVTNITYISGANSEDYTVPATNPTENTTLYYRRKMIATASTACEYYTNSVAITTSPAAPATPVAITGDPTQCVSVSGQVYSIPAVANVASYNWYVPPGWVITEGQGTTSIVVTTGTTFPVYDSVRVTAKNGCGETTQSLGVSLNPEPAKPVANVPTNITCNSATLQWDEVTNAAGYYVDIATDSGFANLVSGYNNLYFNYYSSGGYYAGGLPLGTLYFRVRATNSCNTSVNSDTIIFATAIGGTVSSNQSICSGTQPANLVLSGVSASVIRWEKATNADFTSATVIPNTTTTLTAAEMGPLSSNTYYRAVVQTASCGPVNSSYVLITVNPLPTLGGITQNTIACSGSGATINLTGLLPNSISTINYTIGSTPKTTNATADALGNANFITDVLTIANGDNGKVLTIDTITTTSTTPNCSKNFTGYNVSLIVKNDSGDIALNAVTPPAGTVTYPELTTATFSIPAVSGATTYNWDFPDDWTVTSVPDNLPTITVVTGTISGNVSVYTDALFCPSYLAVSLSDIPPPAPVVSLVQPTCPIPTSTVTVTSPVPASGIVYTIIGTNPVVAAETNDTGVFTKLAVGEYSVTYQIDTDPVSNPLTVAISPPVIETTTWTGTWSNGAPNNNKHVVFAAPYPDILTNLEACSCEVAAGVNLSVGVDGDLNDDAILEIENDLNVIGTLTFYNNASLVQKNNFAVNSGVIKYNRTTPAIKDYDYVYWSAPLENQSLDLFEGSDKNWYYEGGKWIPAAGLMTPAKGYIIRVRNKTLYNIEFEGKPNNGIYSINTQTTGSNLIGNPYPSAIDAELFIKHNSTIIGGALNFWTHIVPRTINGDGTKYQYSSTDYATFTLTGGTATGTGSESGSAPPTGYIAAGQSFFVEGSGGSFEFTNEMRIAETNKNAQFFKYKKDKNKTEIEKNRVWLNLTNDEGAFKQLLIGYVTGATNDFDKLYDGTSLDGNAFVDFYSIDNSKKYTIQGRALPFDNTEEVTLGYKTAIDGTFTIGIDKADGVFVNQSIYLKDKATNTISDLSKGSYSFTTLKGEFQDRFVLLYKYSSLGTEDNNVAEKGVVVSENNKQIKINSFDENMHSVKVYDLKGSLLFEKNNINDNECIIKDLLATNQLLIVLTQLENGQKFSNKVIKHN